MPFLLSSWLTATVVAATEELQVAQAAVEAGGLQTAKVFRDYPGYVIPAAARISRFASTRST